MKKDEKVFKYNQSWIFWLTVGWLIATFEHNYYTIANYSLGKIWNIFGTAIPISDISAFIIVVVLDLSMFFSIQFIPTGKRWDIKMIGVTTVLIVSTSISILLNVRYMIEASPSDTWFDLSIGIIIGVLIPLFVVLFGYIEGHVVDSQFSEEGKIEEVPVLVDGKVTSKMIAEARKKNPSLTRSDLAKMFSMPRSEIKELT